MFPIELLHSIIGGSSAIDLPRLYLDDLADAVAFLAGYGFDTSRDADRRALEHLRTGAWALIEEELLVPGLSPPRSVRERADIPPLLLAASSAEGPEQRWACALLRVMHGMAHVRSPFEERHGKAIREQILGRFRAHMRRDEGGLWLGADADAVPLVEFTAKEAKTPRSTAMKLLHRAENVAEEVFDRVGVRFVTPTPFDALLVVRYLRRHHVVTVPNVVPTRSRNTMVDLDELRAADAEVAAAVAAGVLLPHAAVDALRARVLAAAAPEGLRTVYNAHSAKAWRSIQFTCRQVIRVPDPEAPGGELRFFFPYEVQVLDAGSHAAASADPAANHEAYKERQRASVRARVLGALARP